MLTKWESSNYHPVSNFKGKNLLLQKVLDIVNVRTPLHSSLTAHLSSTPCWIGTRDRQEDNPHQAEDGGDLVRENNVGVSAAVRLIEPS